MGTGCASVAHKLRLLLRYPCCIENQALALASTSASDQETLRLCRVYRKTRWREREASSCSPPTPSHMVRYVCPALSRIVPCLFNSCGGPRVMSQRVSLHPPLRYHHHPRDPADRRPSQRRHHRLLAYLQLLSLLLLLCMRLPRSRCRLYSK